MAQVIFEDKALDGRRIQIVPVTIDHIAQLGEVKKGFTEDMQQYLQDTIVWYRANRLAPSSSVAPFVHGHEYHVLDRGKKIAEIGVYDVGWWPEDSALIWIDKTPSGKINGVAAVIDNLATDRRIVLVETPAAECGCCAGGNTRISHYLIRKGTSSDGLQVVEGNIDSSIFQKCEDFDIMYYAAIDPESKLVGFTGRYNFRYSKKPVSWLGWTGVPIPERGQHIGLILLNAMIEQAKMLGHREMRIETYGGEAFEAPYAAANGLYKRQGFNLAAELPDFFGKTKNMKVYSKNISKYRS